MIRIIDVIVILIAHFIGDFLCQSRRMANNKSRNIWWLATHGIIYSSILFILLIAFTYHHHISIFLFALLNGIVHIIVDKFSSYYSNYFYFRHKIYQMFCVLGGDQLIHTLILLITANWIFY